MKSFLYVKNPMLQLFLLAFFFTFQQSISKQVYDPTACSSPKFSPGSLYTCSITPTSCNTFIVYRSREGFSNVSEISNLFRLNEEQVLKLNRITNSSHTLQRNRELLLPVHCSCSNGFFQSMLNYTVSSVTAYTDISCDVFEGLVKFSTLAKENPYDPNNLKQGLKLNVPLKCACPDSNDMKNGFQYLVTYPIQESDEPRYIAEKFSTPLGDLFAQNSQGQDSTVFTNTTILVPLRNMQSINWNISNPKDEVHRFIPFSPSKMIKRRANTKNLYAIGAIIGLFLMFVVFGGLSFYNKGQIKRGGVKIGHSFPRSSTPSCLSPDLLAVMSKYSLNSYAIEELSKATESFNKETQLGASVYKGKNGETDLVIKKMGFGDARRTIGIHSKINHASIVKLEGVCYGSDEFSPSFLVFEFVQNGCLRDCLKNSANALSWNKRAQIAFDVAIGLHYIHHCTIPSYVHMNVTSKNILITKEWRAKIANFGAGSVINSSKERGSNVAMISDGWIPPEYFHYGLVSAKIDVFAFGVVLFEILSAKQVRDGRFMTESLRFLNGGGLNGCFDELRGFLDPNLDEYPIGDALCMIVLAKGCVEENSVHRPSMNDILKILARMVR